MTIKTTDNNPNFNSGDSLIDHGGSTDAKSASGLKLDFSRRESIESFTIVPWSKVFYPPKQKIEKTYHQL